MQKTRIGIVGYGNLGRGVELALKQCPDMELVGVFTRRQPEKVEPACIQTKVMHIEDAEGMGDKIDVMILCGGSAGDLPKQGPHFARLFNTIDSFDTHAGIPEYYEKMNQAAQNPAKSVSFQWAGIPVCFPLVA